MALQWRADAQHVGQRRGVPGRAQRHLAGADVTAGGAHPGHPVPVGDEAGDLAVLDDVDAGFIGAAGLARREHLLAGGWRPKVLITAQGSLGGSPVGATWNGFAAVRRIDIPADHVRGGSDIPDYMLLVDKTSLRLRSTGNGGIVQTTDGKDVRFTLTGADVKFLEQAARSKGTSRNELVRAIVRKMREEVGEGLAA